MDYFLARYYSSTQGRFTSPDEFTGGPDELYDFTEIASDNPTFYADFTNPQSLNKYQYVYNNPLRYTDDDGHCGVLCLAGRAAAAGARTPAGQRLITAAGATATTAIVGASGVIKKVGIALLDANSKGTCPGISDCDFTPQQYEEMFMEARGLDKAEGDAKGDYSNVPDPKNPREGGDFTKRQKRQAREENQRQNGGEMRSDKDGKPINKPKRTVAGERRDPREAQLDHKDSKANGGSNRSSNIRVISAEENQKKGKKSEP